jgi:tripartite-type tricarboxylate transporter receptor subunit TctC
LGPRASAVKASRALRAFTNYETIHSLPGHLRSGHSKPAGPLIPAIGEFVSGYETSAWWGLCAPKNTPAVVVERLSNETSAALADPALKARLAALGADPMVMGPAEFGKLIADETEKWAEVIKFAGIKAE